MAKTRPGKQKRAGKSGFDRRDWRLFFCVTILLCAVLLKYADVAPADVLRKTVSQAVWGGRNADDVLETVGHVMEDSGLSSVFAVQKVAGDSSGAASSAAFSTSSAETEYKEPGGFEEDLIDRSETSFPDVSDSTVYLMKFDHVNPVPEAELTSSFGIRTHPISGKKTFHFGLDLAAEEGTPIGAFANGTVRETGNNGYGNYVIVDHTDGFSTLYAHCSKLLCAKGDTVTKGQEIAQVGATGYATGNHLHLEIWRAGKALDPRDYIEVT